MSINYSASCRIEGLGCEGLRTGMRQGIHKILLLVAAWSDLWLKAISTKQPVYIMIQDRHNHVVHAPMAHL